MTMSRFARRFCVPALLALLCTSFVLAQRGGLNDPRPLQDVFTSYETAPGTGVLVFTVSSERTNVHLDRQALLKLVNLSNQAALWQTTDDTSQGVFTNVAFGNYDVEISAVGFLSAHKEIAVSNFLRPQQIEIVLHRDPSAINLDLADRVMSPKARKETKRAVIALKSGNLKEAERHLTEAHTLDPSSPDLFFLLGYLYFQKRDYAQAGNYLSTATTANPRNAQALTLLGRTGLERSDYPTARSALEKAILADDENWVPHNLLADAYLREKNYDRARDEAQVAIERGKINASPAELVLGQALVALGHNQEGVKALNLFLDQSPRHPLAGQVRTLISEIQAGDSDQASGPALAETTAATQPQFSGLHFSGAKFSGGDFSGVDPLDAVPLEGLSIKSWKPPSIDDLPPALATGVACPADQVREESGKRVQEFVDDLARFAAVEELFHQALDEFGIPVRTETRKYNYVATISELHPGFLSVDEYRADKLNLAGYPDQIASTGFAALALVFHPHMRDNFDFNCEGLGSWHGKASWLVHFRQRDDRPNRMHSYKVGNQIRAVPLKGRAWITADTFQIVRIEADMVRPMPEIQLLSEHQDVEYGPIPFARKNTTLWLPRSAEIYFDFRKHRYYRRHSFDHYMLYSVDSEEKRKEPASKPADATKDPT